MLQEITEENFIDFALTAYNLCAGWFGEPKDKAYQHTLVWGKGDFCVRNRLLKEYTLVVRRDYSFDEQVKAAIAHEMYHRFTLLRKRLRRLVWVDEMLAFLTSQQVLYAVGLNDYAEIRLQHYLSDAYSMQASHLKTVRRHPFAVILKKPLYPNGFGAAVALLGDALIKEVDWQEIVSLADCSTWEEWFSSLPLPKRQYAEQALGVALGRRGRGNDN